MGEHFGNSLKIVMNKDKSEPWGIVLNCGRTYYNFNKEELKRVNWEQLWLGMSISDLWELFKGQRIRVQDQHIPQERHGGQDKT